MLVAELAQARQERLQGVDVPSEKAHLIQDEQQAVLVAELAQARQERLQGVDVPSEKAHLIQDEQQAVLVAELAQARQERLQGVDVPSEKAHLIQDEQQAVLVAELAQARQERLQGVMYRAKRRTSSRMSSRPCLSQSLRRPGRNAGGGVRNPPSPRMGSTMTAAVSLGAVCCLSSHSMASSGPLQQRRAPYASYGGMLGSTWTQKRSQTDWGRVLGLKSFCCLGSHSMASSGPLQQRRALYASYGGMLGST